MRVTVTSEQRFFQTPDGAVFTPNVNQYEFWRRYLSVFESVRVVARVVHVERREAQWNRGDGPGVAFAALPYYVGPYQFLTRALAIRRALQRLGVEQDAVIMRAGGIIADCLEPFLRKEGHPFALEVVGDPYDVFSPGANRHCLRRLFRIWATSSLKRLCRSAAGVAYVTKYALQRRYPNRSLMLGLSDVIIPQLSDAWSMRVLSTYYSSISLASSHLSSPADVARAANGLGHKTVVVCVGAFQELYKGQDVLIRAIASCVQMGDDMVLKLVGDGKSRSILEELADDLGIRDRCDFVGEVNGLDAVVRELDAADLFVLPSRQEGLPRAMIEAMARGLPCIGTTVGGIPELLLPEAMVPPNDVQGLAGKIHEFVKSPELRTRMSLLNLEAAAEYTEDHLRERRVGFYQHVRDFTEAWHMQRACGAAQ